MPRELTPQEKAYDFYVTVGRGMQEDFIIDRAFNLGLAEPYLIFDPSEIYVESEGKSVPDWAEGYYHEGKTERDGWTAEELLCLAHELEEKSELYPFRSRKRRDWDAEIWEADFLDWFDEVWKD